MAEIGQLHHENTSLADRTEPKRVCKRANGVAQKKARRRLEDPHDNPRPPWTRRAKEQVYARGARILE